jgi:hypothetical protein
MASNARNAVDMGLALRQEAFPWNRVLIAQIVSLGHIAQTVELAQIHDTGKA